MQSFPGNGRRLEDDQTFLPLWSSNASERADLRLATVAKTLHAADNFEVSWVGASKFSLGGGEESFEEEVMKTTPRSRR